MRAQLLYKYLPEPMRNPQTFEWMLSNPEYRKQLEAMMQQQVCVRAAPAQRSCKDALGRHKQRIPVHVVVAGSAYCGSVRQQSWH
jgi:hypothetical protein